MSKRLGVYVCHCGTNIDGMVDVTKISDEIGAEERPGGEHDRTQRNARPQIGAGFPGRRTRTVTFP